MSHQDLPQRLNSRFEISSKVSDSTDDYLVLLANLYKIVQVVGFI